MLGFSNLDYIATFLGISRLGHTVLFLSTRISVEAYVRLLKGTKASFLLVDPKFKDMGVQVQGEMSLNVKMLCTSKDYIRTAASSVSTTSSRTYLDATKESSNIAWIIHSSGSTGLPKPIYQTHKGALNNYIHNFGLRGFITLPLFHAHGLSCLFRAIHARKLIYVYNADLPLTASHLLTTIRQHTEIQILYAVPYALKLLSESEEGIKRLASLDLVMSGGSACPKPIGDKLTSQGVTLISHYGTTETGQLMSSFRPLNDKDWDFVRPSPGLLPYIRWEEQTSGIFELCVLDGWPSLVTSNRPDKSYATKDLFERHPTTPNAWRYYARLDDTLVLENGEKANPLLIEGVAKNNANIAEAVVFGANRPRIGLFLIASPTTSCKTPEQLVDLIWPALVKANDVVPAYSRLSRDMITVLAADTEYRKTDKGTVIRAAFYRDFQGLIDAAYDEAATNGSLVLDSHDLIAFLRKELLEIATIPNAAALQDDTDLFSLGVDSLQSIRLRSVILKSIDVGGQKLSQNFCFEYPSLEAMATELVRLRLGESQVEKSSIEERMMALIEKYSSFPKHVPVQRQASDGECVVVTGATGSLGAHIVAQLAASPTVNKIYCLVRAPDGPSATRRVLHSMQERRVYQPLSPEARNKITSLPSNFADLHLGLDENTYHTLAAETTSLIHCAWSVNFNLSLESFDHDCIAGTHNLLLLCLDAHLPQPAHFSFCSSVSTVAASPGPTAPETLPPSLLHAQKMGYAQSKLVTEHVVSRYALQQTGSQARVLRIGQIIADTKYGIWNANEAIPMIFLCARTIGALPALDETPSWTPVDVVAAAVIELSLLGAMTAASQDSLENVDGSSGSEGIDGEHEDENIVYNLTNPHLFHWTHDLLPLLHSTSLGSFEVLPPKEWVQKLRDSEQDPRINPPIKLLGFWEEKYGRDRRGPGLGFETKRAVLASRALREARVVDEESVEKFVGYFVDKCWKEK